MARFFQRVASAVRDPVTGCPPTREVELSAVFAYMHSRDEIAWSRVTPRFVDNGTSRKTLEQTLGQPGQMLAEYPLFCMGPAEVHRWGKMRADALYVSDDRSTVVMFEGKVDGLFTYGETPPDGQLCRQLEYLSSFRGSTKGLVLLCPGCNVDWYFSRLSECWRAVPDRTKVFACVVKWEEVLGLPAG